MTKYIPVIKILNATNLHGVRSTKRILAVSTGLFLAGIVLGACGGEASPTFYIAGIPDQNAAKLARRYESLTSYLEERLGIDVKFVPTVDYAATVVAFERADVHMAWFGGLTGVQARRMVPGSEAIAHRPRDAWFHSKFIVQADLEVDGLEDLRGLTFTFGSESSTSGHLMPRHFLLEAGLDPDDDFKGNPSYSGSHDKTWKLVESGAFQTGALSEAVWEAAVAEGKVDLTRVREFFTTPSYFDYNWTVRGDLDATFGPGFKNRVRVALLDLGDGQQHVLNLFSAKRFVTTRNENYAAIESVAEALGIVE